MIPQWILVQLGLQSTCKMLDSWTGNAHKQKHKNLLVGRRRRHLWAYVAKAEPVAYQRKTNASISSFINS